MRIPKVLSSITRYEVLLAAAFLATACGKDGGGSPYIASAAAGPVTGSLRAPACTTCKLFVSATTQNGNWGATAAAAKTAMDAACMADANKPADGGTYKALVVSSVRTACTSASCASAGEAEHLDWVLFPNTPYYRADGVTAIGTTTSVSTFAFPLTNTPTAAVHSTQSGFPNGATWITDAAQDCSNWTDGTAASSSSHGQSNQASAIAFFPGGAGICTAVLGLYCVEQ
jgi:hypothetical protein